MQKARFYHAGCPVCVEAEQNILSVLDGDKVALEVVHLGENGGRIAEAEKLGVNSVPALVLDETVLHINFGAALSDLKN